MKLQKRRIGPSMRSFEGLEMANMRWFLRVNVKDPAKVKRFMLLTAVFIVLTAPSGCRSHRTGEIYV